MSVAAIMIRTFGDVITPSIGPLRKIQVERTDRRDSFAEAGICSQPAGRN